MNLPLSKSLFAQQAEPGVGFSEGVRLLVQAAQGLPVSGWEVSCRISAEGVSTDRLLLGFDTLGVSKTRLHQLPDVFEMPVVLAEEFQRELARSHQVLLAMESTAQGLESRAYLSFAAPESGMRGFKWLSHEPSKFRVTDYSREVKSLQAIVEFYEQKREMSSPESLALSGAAYSAAAEIARFAKTDSSPHAPLEFFSVSERVGARQSSCFRLYESGLKFTDIETVVGNLLARYQLEAHWPRVQALMAARPLGWIAVGEDSLGIPFLTLYGEASVLDARRLMVFGAGR